MKIFIVLLVGMHSAVRAEPVVGDDANEPVLTLPVSGVLNPDSGTRLDLPQLLVPTTRNVLNSNEPKYIHQAGTTKIRTTGFDESALDYRCGGDFCVWWDKRFDHAENAEDTLRWANLSLSKCIEQDMRLPDGYKTYYLNIYLHHKGNEGAGEDIFPDNWGQGVGGDYNDVPMTVFPYPKEKVAVDARKPYGDLPHEIFHVCQYSKLNYDYNYYAGEGHFAGWIIEAAASWFQFKMLPYEEVKYPDWYNGFYAGEAVNFQPQLSIWGGISEADGTWRSWSFGVHRYGMHILLTYLNRLGYLDGNYVYKMFNAPNITGNPQKDLYDSVIGFPVAYRKFALNMLSLDFLTPKERDGFVLMSNWWDENIERLDGTGDFKNDFNRYFAILKDSGTQGYISPVEKNQAWSWTVLKIENTSPASYKIEFDGNLIGDNGTKSDFYVGTFMEGGAQRYGEIPLTNQKGSGTINIPKNTTAYVVVVNTPYSFEGSETFDYRIKVERSANAVTYPIAVKTNGSGVVVSNPAGINCGPVCTATFTSGASISLTASPMAGHSFNEWSGACSGTGPCKVTMDSAKNVTATFTAIAPPPGTYALAVNKSGLGTVTSTPTGINCGVNCSASFTGGTSVTLTATPASGYVFAGWEGACTGTAACSVVMDSAKSVSAIFTQHGSGPTDPFEPNKPFVKSIIPSLTAIVKKPFTIGWQLNRIHNKMPVRVKFAKDGVAYRVIKSAKSNATGIGSYRWKPTRAHRTGNGLLQICAVPSKGIAEVCSPSTSITVQ